MMKTMMVRTTMPGKRDLRPMVLMTHHEQIFPTTPTAVTPTPMSNDREVGRPATSGRVVRKERVMGPWDVRLTLEEICGVAEHKVDTAERVDSPNSDDDQSSTEIGSSEAVEVTSRLSGLFFHANRFLDLNEPALNTSTGLESFERLLGFSMFAPLHIPIWGFRAEPDTDNQDCRE